MLHIDQHVSIAGKCIAVEKADTGQRKARLAGGRR